MTVSETHMNFIKKNLVPKHQFGFRQKCTTILYKCTELSVIFTTNLKKENNKRKNCLLRKLTFLPQEVTNNLHNIKIDVLLN